MPEFAQYELPMSQSEINVQPFVQAGRHVGAFYNQWGEALRDFGNRVGTELGRSVADAGDAAVKWQEHREISHGAAAWAGLNDQLTQAWNETAKNADPNDPMVAQKFREEQLEPALEKFGQGFWTEGGQKWAETRVDALRNHMFEKTSADMSTLAAAAVSQNVRQMSNALSNTAMQDPSSVPHLIDSVKHSVGGMVDSSPNIKGVDAARAKMEVTEKSIEAIVKAGAQGAVERSGDPEATAAMWGQRYPQYISGAELKTLSSFARSQIRAQRMDEAYSRHLSDLDRNARDDTAKSEVLRNLYSDDPEVQKSVNAKAIVNNPNIKPATAENLIRLIDREMKPETAARISQQTSVDLLRRFREPDADLDKLYEEAWKARTLDPGMPGSMTQKDFNDFRTEIEARKTPQGAALAADRNEFFKRYAATIDPDAPMQMDPHSSQKMYAAEMDARRQEGVLRQKGLDPHLVYDPRSEYFFGNPANLAKYNVNLQDKMKAKAAEQQTAPAAASTKFAPPPDWQWSPSRQRYRDSSGKEYDADGKPTRALQVPR